MLGNGVKLKIAYVFVSFGFIVITRKFVNSQVELCFMLYDRFVQGREKNMFASLLVREPNDKQSMVFAGIARG
jgi:hypothetical protein